MVEVKAIKNYKTYKRDRVYYLAETKANELVDKGIVKVVDNKNEKREYRVTNSGVEIKNYKTK